MTGLPTGARSLRGGLPYLSGGLAILCWASLAAAVGGSLHAMPPETVLFYGLLTAGLALALVEMLRARRFGLPWPGWRAALYGVYGIWGYHTLLVLSFALAPDVEANILNYTWTLWIVVLGSLLPGHGFTKAILAAGALGFAGVVLVIGGGLMTGAAGLDTLVLDAAVLDAAPAPALGFALALAGGLCWGSFTAFMRLAVPAKARYAPLFTLLSAGVAGAFLLLRGASPLVAPDHWPVLAYLGLVPLGLSFLLWEYAAQRCNVQVLGMMSFFTPALSTLLLAWVSGQAVGLNVYGGLALILTGAAVGTRSMRGRKAGAPDAGKPDAGKPDAGAPDARP